MSTPLKILQQNASNFFDKFFEENKTNMKCGNGCAKCCHVELSIYTAEANLILDWFKNLDKKSKIKIVENVSTQGRCTFLDEKNSCLIYEVRPVICRTQGALLLYKENEEAYIDICPLNFEKNELPDAKKALDLDRLNMLLATCQKHTEVSLEVKEVANGERISLRALKEILLTHISPKNNLEK